VLSAVNGRALAKGTRRKAFWDMHAEDMHAEDMHARDRDAERLDRSELPRHCSTDVCHAGR
jgi:hypothetical protein